MASVTVRGFSQASVQPDRVIVSLGLTHLGSDAASAMDEVARRSHLLEAAISALHIERGDWVTDGVSVGEEWQWRNDANVLVGHRANSGVSVTLRDMSLVGVLIRAAVAECSANVRGLNWLVDSDNPTRLALLGEAAADARVRAAAYVAALGLRLGEVELIDESPIASSGGASGGQEMVAYASAKMMGDGAAPMSVSAGQVEISAAVHVRFAILPGT